MIVKPRSRIIQDLDAASFTVLGCSGADGLGAGALRTFRDGLIGARGDFIVVLGDISPLGRDPYYRRVSDFTNLVAEKPVHVVRGNHDGPDYSAYFGLENRAVVSEEYLLIMLDNSTRRFTDETLVFLRETMALIDSANVLIAFHVPPPNRFNGNSMPRAEWQRFEDAVGVWRNRISLLIASHAHNCFEDEVDGLRLVATGGAGARMHPADRLSGQEHHALEITPGDRGMPEISARRLSPPDGVGEIPLPGSLREFYADCCRRRIELTFRAEEAEALGLYNLAKLHRAGAESALHQARSLRALPDCEVLIHAAREGAEAARQSFATLLDRVSGAAGGDIESSNYFVCGSCGFTYALGDSPTYCSACGAPGVFIEEAGV